MLTLQEGTRDGFVETAIGRLHYVSAGSGFPVVLLHGWPQTWFEWRHVIARLAPRYRVIAPDLRGLPPIYPVVIGIRDPVQDISLQQVTVSQTSIGGVPAIEVTVRAALPVVGLLGPPRGLEVSGHAAVETLE